MGLLGKVVAAQEYTRNDVRNGNRTVVSSDPPAKQHGALASVTGASGRCDDAGGLVLCVEVESSETSGEVEVLFSETKQTCNGLIPKLPMIIVLPFYFEGLPNVFSFFGQIPH